MKDFDLSWQAVKIKIVHVVVALIYSASALSQGIGTPGSVAPDAVVLEVGEIYDFAEGSAVVSKNGKTALIDAKGAFVIPFGAAITPALLPNDNAANFKFARFDSCNFFALFK